MRHMVFGAGLIGCYLGACISRHYSVSLVCRDKVRQNLSNGIKLTDYQNHQFETKQLQFCHTATEFEGHADVIWLTVKCTGVEKACQDMKPYVGNSTLILCAQNGLGSHHIVQQYFPQNGVLRVMVPFNVVDMGQGHFHRGSQGTLTLESTHKWKTIVEPLATELNSDLLPVTCTEDMTALLWAKLQLNLGNSVNALANIPVKSMLEQRPYRLIIAAMMKELLAVTDKMRMELPKVANIPGKLLPLVLSLPDWLFKRLANKMLAIDPQVRTSMWWDISAGKTTEIDFLNGAIVEQAKQVSVNCPVNEKIISLIKELELTGHTTQALSAAKLYNLVFR